MILSYIFQSADNDILSLAVTDVIHFGKVKVDRFKDILKYKVAIL